MTTNSTSADPSLEKVWNQVESGEKVHVENIKGLYDNWTSSYDEDLRKHRYYGPSYAGSTFAEHCPEKGVHILDIGSGTGLVGEQLHALGYTDIVGVDISRKSLDVADKKGVYKRLVCAEVGKDKLPFGNNEFDGLVCCGCMLPNHFRPGCLREWVRVVRPGN
ncbi:Methyltransferase-like protein 27 [Holothuria leucospilota]|uniref:Methyltransferase-like protein 27 n=1 Tax=Holothuria leucospilota TaxID=206669 RepID=A0A9Q1CCF7_HOLLE|nr:Methyltransferase-like protein 27 [Holothuria leucospilota]